MKIRYASLVSPRGMYGTKYHDVVLKRDVKRFLTDLKKQINLILLCHIQYKSQHT